MLFNLMEENNGESLENFSWYISQKFDINESDLISCLHNDKNNYWNTLFSLIKEKTELMNDAEAGEENNNNIKNEIENKDEIVKEIDKYFKENPEEAEPTWNKYKKEVLKINNVRNSNPPKEKSMASKIIDKKINNNNNIKTNNNINHRASLPKKRKQSFAIQKDNIQKFNFSIGFPSSGPQGNDNVMRKTMNISNNFNFLQNKQKNKKNKIANSRPSKIDNNNKFRNSMYLKIKKNPNFEYAPKKFLNPKNMRKSINQQQNQSASFNYSFNNSNDNKQSDSTVIKISKKKFDELIHKNTIEEKENEFDKNIYEEIDEKDEDKGTGKKEEQSDNKSENKNENGYENEEKILSFEESDSKVNLEDINNNNETNINEKNKDLTNKVTEYNIENKPDYSKDYELSKEATNQKIQINDEKEKNKDIEEKDIPLYKKKDVIFTLKKPKPKPKPKVRFSSDIKSNPKPKVYINLSLCRQVSFSLNIKNNSQNLTNSVPSLLKEKQEETNKTLESVSQKDAIKKNNSSIITTRSDQKPVRKNLALKNQKLVNNRSKIINNNNSNQNNLSYRIFKINSQSKNKNINMRNKNNFPKMKINNNSFNMKMNNTFYRYDKNDNHKSEYLKTYQNKEVKIRPLHNSQQNLNSKNYKNNRYDNKNYNKNNKINKISGIHKLKSDINRKNRSSTKERGSSKKRKKNRVLNGSIKSRNNLNENENEIDKIKNNYLKKYQATIENIMKNDDTIFSENSHIKSYTDRENKTDRNYNNKKNNSSLSYYKTKIKIKKSTNSKSKISPKKSKRNKVGSKNAIKRFIHISMDNIN